MIGHVLKVFGPVEPVRCDSPQGSARALGST